MNITGRVTADAKVNSLQGSKQVVNFSVAVNETYRNSNGERVQLTEYLDCAYWISPKVAEILRKGTLVELTGRVSARAWTNANGELRAGLNFHTSVIKLHGSPNRSETAKDVAGSETDKPIDDMPFPF